MRIILALLVLHAAAGAAFGNAAGTPEAGTPLPLLDRSVFARRDLIFGAEIGAWDQDGGVAVNLRAARGAILAARVPVIRWGVWAKFQGLGGPGASARLSRDQFDKGIDGIRSLGAIPFLKLPPIWDQQGEGGKDPWSLVWLREIVRQAGRRVQLYEFANEPDHYLKWDAATYARHWSTVAPELKRTARAMGFEIFLGGPAMANSYPHNVAYLQSFLEETAAAYRRTGDRDYVPDFVSSHTYLTEKENASREAMQARIDAWGEFFGEVRQTIDTAYAGLKDAAGAPLGPQIQIADSEYNWTINHQGTRMEDRAYAEFYLRAMVRMFRERGVWMANLFTIASHKGDALDMLRPDGAPKPLYQAFKAVRTAELPTPEPKRSAH